MMNSKVRLLLFINECFYVKRQQNVTCKVTCIYIHKISHVTDVDSSVSSSYVNVSVTMAM